MKELFMQVMSNAELVVAITGIVIFALTQLFKMPIKHFTNKIKNDRIRRIVNITILVIPFALGVGFEFIYSMYVYFDAFELGVGIAYGSSAVFAYSIVERFLKVKLPNPFATEEGKAFLQLVDTVSEDGKIDENDKDAIKAFWDKVK